MKAVWAIIVGFGAMMILCVGMIFVTMPRKQQISHVVMPVPCNCRGQCVRRK